MPTRFSFSASKEKMKRQFNIDHAATLQQSFNIGAMQNAYVQTKEQKELQVYSWGLIPSWAKDKKAGENLITVQAEGIASKISFRLPIRQKRCLVFADSYYWWKKEGRVQYPHRVQLASNDLMTFAGVWESWQDNNGEILNTFSIITTPANPYLSEQGALRMPALLGTEEARQTWLHSEDLATALDLLQPYQEAPMELYPISNDIDSLENNYPELHKALPPQV
jgi:putative SOS response-associated peptidase YedK